jgi:mRNA-degrading endonuclease toxin of MazEF toxin-antitoxin module
MPSRWAVLRFSRQLPATGTIRGIETEVEIGPGEGMPRSWVLSVDNTISAKKAFFTERITTLDAAKMDEVCRALAVATGC